MVVEVSSNDELQEIIQSNDTVIVELGASWCGPCRQFRPHFDTFAEKHPEVVCVYADVDLDQHGYMSEYDFMTVPQIYLFRGGSYVKDLQTYRTAVRLERALEE